MAPEDLPSGANRFLSASGDEQDLPSGVAEGWRASRRRWVSCCMGPGRGRRAICSTVPPNRRVPETTSLSPESAWHHPRLSLCALSGVCSTRTECADSSQLSSVPGRCRRAFLRYLVANIGTSQVCGISRSQGGAARSLPFPLRHLLIDAALREVPGDSGVANAARTAARVALPAECRATFGPAGPERGRWRSTGALAVRARP